VKGKKALTASIPKEYTGLYAPRSGKDIPIQSDVLCNATITDISNVRVQIPLGVTQINPGSQP
jgi:hypothetical protein